LTVLQTDESLLHFWAHLSKYGSLDRHGSIKDISISQSINVLQLACGSLVPSGMPWNNLKIGID